MGARRLLIVLHAALGALALPAGIALAARPSGEALRFEAGWLAGSPFENYRVPGLFLAVVIGGTNLVSAAALASRRPGAELVSLGSGVLLLVWIAIQTRIIGLRDWTQPVWAAVFLLVTVLAAREVRGQQALRSASRAEAMER